MLFISGRNWVYWPGCLVNLLRGCVVYFRKELDLLAWLSGEPVTSLIHQRIKQHVEHSCQSNFEVPYLFTLEEVCCFMHSHTDICRLAQTCLHHTQSDIYLLIAKHMYSTHTYAHVHIQQIDKEAFQNYYLKILIF